MTIQIKHPFVSAKGDGGDATLVRPSNWNAAHSTSMASGNLLGRLTVGTGVFEEIPVSALVAAALDETTGAAFLAALGAGGFETGDVKFTFKSSPATGWIVMQGGGGTPPSTIGNAASGGVLRANADALALFQVVYAECSDTDAPVSGGRTGNSLNDFNAGKTIRVPNPVGRAIIGAGAGTDAPPGGGGATTSKTIGRGYGAETHALSVGELATHFHSAGIFDPTHSHTMNGLVGLGTNGLVGSGGINACTTPSSNVASAASTAVRVNSPNGLDTTYSTGSGTAHNNIQPSVALYVHIKL